jgi:hypothetical protein
MKIFGWYLVWGCIRGQRCVAQKNRVDATFGLDSVTLKPKFPSTLYILNKWRFLVDIWCEDVWGQRCVRQKICIDVTFDLNPVTMTPNCMIFPFRSIIPKRLKIFGWYLVGECTQNVLFFIMFILCVSLGRPCLFSDKWIWGLAFVYKPVKLINSISVCCAWWRTKSGPKIRFHIAVETSGKNGFLLVMIWDTTKHVPPSIEGYSSNNFISQET